MFFGVSVMWLTQPGYVQGIFWFIVVALTSSVNDMLVKVIGSHIGGGQVLFFRFFFSMLTLLPFIKICGIQAFRTQHHKVHLIRGFFLFLALTPWCYGLIDLPLTLATTLSFTTPLFVLLFARLFLKEKISWPRGLATLCGFLGVVLSVQPSLSQGHYSALMLVAATIVFALLDIMNKKLLNVKEGLIPLLFYSALWTAIFSTPMAFYQWNPIALKDLGLLVLLGMGANFILYGLLMAFRCCDLSALQPLRYIEFLISALFQWLLYQTFVSTGLWIALFFIIPSTLYVTYYETQKDTS